MTMNPFPKLLEEGLINTNHVECAAILVAKTGDVTAASNFTVCPEQTQMFIDSFKHLNVTRQRGLNFRSKLFTCVRADKHSIYTKCLGYHPAHLRYYLHKRNGIVCGILDKACAGEERHGLILVRTALYVIVATYSQSMYPSICVEAVEKLAEYLREKGK